MDFIIGQIFDGMYPPEAAEWCNNNGYYIEEIETVNNIRRFKILEVPIDEGN